MTTLTSPHDLLAAVPFLIGYHPENSLVIIAIKENQAGLAMRVDYPTELPCLQIDFLISHLLKQQADSALIVGYISARAEFHKLVLDSLVSALNEKAIVVRESLLVDGDRWRSTICQDKECCPPRGRVLPDIKNSRVACERVVDGAPMPFANEKAAKEMLSSHHHVKELAAAIARIAPIDYQASSVQKLQREGAVALNELVQEFIAKRGSDRIDLVALVLVRLLDLQVRDYGLGMATADNKEALLEMWRWLMTISPQGFGAAPAALFAELLYERGDGALAVRALERAELDDPEYTLAKLLRRTFAAGWPPENFAKMRAELHPKITETLFGG